ncbi:MAG TPA: cytochrome c [Verrucomicrobiae bacterium]|nr:cytochrome c [Verrucomicrobiae bacterium]
MAETQPTQPEPVRAKRAPVIILTVLIILLLETGALLAVIYSGVYNIGTYNHDTGWINHFLDTSMTRAVQSHAHGVQVPALSDPAMVQGGFMHYDNMCAQCHGAPGVEPDDIAKGLWPKAPNLAKTVPTWTPAELFWITKYGIKFSAMPAWGPTHDDKKIWSMVAFLEKLPHLSPQDYQNMKGQPASEQHKPSAEQHAQ